LTLLAGANAAGKTSVIQALVLLHQTMRSHEWSSRLMLNGELVQLGTAGAVIDEVTGRRECEIGVSDTRTRCLWTFAGDRHAMSMRLRKLAINDREARHPGQLRRLVFPSASDLKVVKTLLHLTYLTAERLGPRETYPIGSPNDIQTVGPCGENAVSLFLSQKMEQVAGSLIADADSPDTPARQVEAWMRAFFPGCELAAARIPATNAATLRLGTARMTSLHRPIHTGFGLTQVFPVVVAALFAERGSLFVIENPEVHLHPAGQSSMGMFLARVAAAGVQVVVETHSDHVLNGIRRAVRTQMLSSRDVAIHYFRPRGAPETPQVETLAVRGDGGVESWPDGFFDQYERDLGELAGWA